MQAMGTGANKKQAYDRRLKMAEGVGFPNSLENIQ
jgi:hypothetical protein